MMMMMMMMLMMMTMMMMMMMMMMMIMLLVIISKIMQSGKPRRARHQLCHVHGAPTAQRTAGIAATRHLKNAFKVQTMFGCIDLPQASPASARRAVADAGRTSHDRDGGER